MTIVDTVRAEMTTAWKAGDTARRDALRLMVSALDNGRIAARHELSDEESIQVLQREAKQRRDSIEEFEKGGREDLAEKERGELEIIEGYLPAQMGEDELREIVRATVEEVGAAGPGDLGKVMGPLMGKLAGRADGKVANQIVRELLASE
jgi:uncharacterized protein YqeY